MFSVRYELGFYIPEDDIPHSHCCENLKSYIVLTGWTLYRRRMFPVRYELGFYIPEDDFLHSHRRENLKPYVGYECCVVSKSVMQQLKPMWEDRLLLLLLHLPHTQ
jgi:hypothetical protein